MPKSLRVGTHIKTNRKINIQKLNSVTSFMLSEEEMINVLGGENNVTHLTNLGDKDHKCDKCDKCATC